MKPDHPKLTASARGLRLVHPTGELAADGPVELRIDGRQVHVEPVALVGFDSRIEVEASYDPGAGERRRSLERGHQRRPGEASATAGQRSRTLQHRRRSPPSGRRRHGDGIRHRDVDAGSRGRRHCHARSTGRDPTAQVVGQGAGRQSRHSRRFGRGQSGHGAPRWGLGPEVGAGDHLRDRRRDAVFRGDSHQMGRRDGRRTEVRRFGPRGRRSDPGGGTLGRVVRPHVGVAGRRRPRVGGRRPAVRHQPRYRRSRKIGRQSRQQPRPLRRGVGRVESRRQRGGAPHPRFGSHRARWDHRDRRSGDQGAAGDAGVHRRSDDRPHHGNRAGIRHDAGRR